MSSNMRVSYDNCGRRVMTSYIKSSKTVADKKTLQEKRRELRDTEIKFAKASRQLMKLNKLLADLSFRYNKAKGDNFKSFRYNLKLKLSVLEGIRSKYYDYVYMKAEDINMLRHDVRFWVEESSESEYESDEYRTEDEE